MLSQQQGRSKDLHATNIPRTFLDVRVTLEPIWQVSSHKSQYNTNLHDIKELASRKKHTSVWECASGITLFPKSQVVVEVPPLPMLRPSL